MKRLLSEAKRPGWEVDIVNSTITLTNFGIFYVVAFVSI